MTTTNSTKTTKTLASVCSTRYGIELSAADAITVEWSAAALAEAIGVQAAAKSWKKENSRRNRSVYLDPGLRDPNVCRVLRLKQPTSAQPR